MRSQVQELKAHLVRLDKELVAGLEEEEARDRELAEEKFRLAYEAWLFVSHGSLSQPCDTHRPRTGHFVLHGDNHNHYQNALLFLKRKPSHHDYKVRLPGGKSCVPCGSGVTSGSISCAVPRRWSRRRLELFSFC